MIPKLYFNIYNKYNMPGNYINGDLLIYNFLYIGLKSINVNFSGIVNDKFETFYNFETFDYKSYETLINRNYKYCFFNNKLYDNIDKNKNFNKILEPGIHKFNINFYLNQTELPSSYDSEKYSIEYYLKFKLEFINIVYGNITNVIYNEKINIIPLIYTFHEELNIPFITPSINTRIKNIKDYMEVSAYIPYRAYIKNDIVNIFIKFKKFTKINFNIIIFNIKLRENIITSKILNYELKNDVYKYKKIFIINNINNSLIKIEDFQIPNFCNYNIFFKTTNNMFEINNEIVINIKISNGYESFILKEIVIPVIIGSSRYNNYINFDNFFDIPEPPSYNI